MKERLCYVLLLLTLVAAATNVIKRSEVRAANYAEIIEQQAEEIIWLSDRLDLLTNAQEVRGAAAPIYNIPLSETLQEHTFQKCKDYGIVGQYELMLGLMWQESNYIPDVISATDDYGLMQINTINHNWLKETLGITDFLDPYQNIDAGTYIFSLMYHKYNDTHKALMAYAFGERGAARLWAKGTYTGYHSRIVHNKTEAIISNKYYK